MKKIFKRGVPLFMALLVLLGVTFTSFESVNATGAEEFLYYTYWDLMTSVFAAQGYDMQIKDGVVNDHGVTGKQVWNNFKTWVKTNVKAVYDEVTLLPKAVTAEGIKMSQELWDAFRDYAAYCSSGSSNLYIQNQHFEMRDILNSVTGMDIPDDHTYAIDTKTSAWLICVTYNKYNGYPTYYLVGASRSWGTLGDAYIDSYGDLCLFCSSANVSATGIRFSVSDSGKFLESYEQYNTTFSNLSNQTVKTLWRDGVTIDSNSDIYSIVSQGACPAEVPDVTPWIKNPTIPDEWRIVQPGEDPKKDPDSNPEKLPVIIPFKPPKPEDPKKPDSTEDTNPDKDKDKDKEKKPAVNPIINPATGNVIDPETGLDIDPNTGKLIDPDTGKLIDPDDGGSGGGGGGGIADKLGKYGDITKLFPFCIPFDIVNLIKGMSAEKAPPVFHFKYYFKSINYTFKVDVDLSQYAKYIKLFRYGMQIFYILALMFMTIRISKLFS